MPDRRVTISTSPSRASQLRVLTATVRAAICASPSYVRTSRKPLALLLEVALADAEGRPINVTDLQQTLMKSQASTSRAIEAHVKAGVLESYTLPEDERKTNLRLTARGRAYINHVLDAMRRQVIIERTRQEREGS